MIRSKDVRGCRKVRVGWQRSGTTGGRGSSPRASDIHRTWLMERWCLAKAWDGTKSLARPGSEACLSETGLGVNCDSPPAPPLNHFVVSSFSLPLTVQQHTHALHPIVRRTDCLDGLDMRGPFVRSYSRYNSRLHATTRRCFPDQMASSIQSSRLVIWALPLLIHFLVGACLG